MIELVKAFVNYVKVSLTIEPRIASFSEADNGVISKMVQIILIFGGGCIASIFFAFSTKSFGFFIFAFLVAGFGFMLAWELYYAVTRKKIIRIEGVLMDIQKTGFDLLTKSTYMIIQTTDYKVYKICVPENKRNYSVGNIVAFYTTSHYLNNFVDGEFIIRSVLAIERVSAVVLPEDEEEMEES